MKNNSGFTLIEILAVILIIAILSIIAFPAVYDAINNSKSAISSIEKKNITDGSNRLALEVLSCDLKESSYNALGINSSVPCTTIQSDFNARGITVTIDGLKNNGYFNDENNRCSGSVFITVDNAYKINVDTSNVSC